EVRLDTGNAAAAAGTAAYPSGLTAALGASRWPMNHSWALSRKVLSSPASVVDPAAALPPGMASTPSSKAAAAIPTLRIAPPHHIVRKAGSSARTSPAIKLSTLTAAPCTRQRGK